VSSCVLYCNILVHRIRMLSSVYLHSKFKFYVSCKRNKISGRLYDFVCVAFMFKSLTRRVQSVIDLNAVNQRISKHQYKLCVLSPASERFTYCGGENLSSPLFPLPPSSPSHPFPCSLQTPAPFPFHSCYPSLPIPTRSHKFN